MFQGYDDIAFLAPGINVAVSLGDLLQRVSPINDGFELARFNQLCEKAQVFGALGG